MSGLKIGVYEHSSVARDILCDILAELGVDVVRFARSDSFVPVDTEAIDVETRTMLEDWCVTHNLDGLVSTDGDADRPMVVDANGRLVPGDVLGPLTALYLGAEVICTPVSSNTLVSAMGTFAEVRRTRIGSPYVIAAMKDAADAKVAGYEANGGFLLGYPADGPAGSITPLMTRDCLLPILTPLVAMRDAKTDLAGLVRSLPPRFTASDRLVNVPTDRSQTWLSKMIDSAAERRQVIALEASESGIDLTDGLRVTFADDRIVHFRPSGNAPELRCYVEADSPECAAALLQTMLERVRRSL